MLCTGGASEVAQESGPLGAKSLPAAQGRPTTPNDFGPGSFILPIPAADFRPICNYTGISYDVTYNGYIYLVGGSPTGGCSLAGTFWAPVQLPSGALITKLGLYYDDTDVNEDVTATLRADCNICGAFDVGSVSSSGSGGAGYSSTGLSYSVNNDMSVQFYGAQLAVIVTLPSVMTLKFKAVEIWYQRQVSPPGNTATFNDVPTNHPFYQFVEALHAAGITVGCNVSPPLYCPDDAVTRGQMAVFLSKALGLGWPYP